MHRCHLLAFAAIPCAPGYAFAAERPLIAAAAALQPALEEADHRLPDAVPAAILRRRVVDDRGAIEGRAKHGGMAHLAAQAAADARVDHLRDRILPQRIGVRRDGEGGAA